MIFLAPNFSQLKHQYIKGIAKFTSGLQLFILELACHPIDRETLKPNTSLIHNQLPSGGRHRECTLEIGIDFDRHYLNSLSLEGACQ